MTTMTIAQTAAYLRQCDDILILTHQAPDGDCIGAGFALYGLLTALGKRARVLCPDEIPARYAFLTCAQPAEFTPAHVCAVDVADPQLLGGLQACYGDRVDLCIDHHISNTGYAAHTCVNPNASATCEVLYELAAALEVVLTPAIATCIYTGIATDTGCFKYENARARAHEIVSVLKRQFDLPYARINREMFDVKSFGRLKMEHLVTDIMEFYLDGRCTMISITRALLDELHVDPADLDGMAGLPLQVEGVEVGVTIKEKGPGCYKISMRSANDANVSRICTGMGGGGHIKAAGCAVEGTLEEVKAKVVAAVEQELNKQA